MSHNVPIIYNCSVPCYKQHKETAHPAPDQSEAGPSRLDASSAPAPSPVSGSPGEERSTGLSDQAKEEPAPPLRALTTLSWPPEPDESIFTDPLRKEDPKPLRRSELLRIAQSGDLRHLLTSTSLPSILRALDALPTPGARSAMLARCLSIDPISLSAPTSSSSTDLLSQRDSPPPLEDLIRAISRQGEPAVDEGAAGLKGFWVGREIRPGEEGVQRVWIGEEERKIMRVFAGLVCKAVDGGEGDAWGQGGLAWEV
ncbi:uncharacterized protein MKK02DRAFT_42872 [Dioszegia hungarica]|uniref:Uncharacterized protein n=1 Tax=Dioszegia hungarica TaxID=4972 RepID=A0AA38HDS3_9TREE|nr:uncharacterized protein MKK02DRAFT_42872 [Dioszegia hungarica]KAI9638478.1 hypothetical protein MKK02DRAFT_42872 [Dioszegia hungarica]